ncbi:MAG: hypothetical protein ACJ8CR_14140, partial [Roseiflexaceae bacterium]
CRLAADLGLTAHLTFAGVQLGEDLARLYAAADVFVNVSVYHRENFGLAQWDILQIIDGTTPVDQIIARLSAQHYTPKDVRMGLWHLYVDGIIMLKRGNTP